MPRGRKPKPIIDGKKQCPRCNEMLPISSFGVDKRAHHGIKSACKPCRASYAKSPKMKEWSREYYRAYYPKNKEAMDAHSRKYLANQPAGVYKITCTKTNRSYIGQSTMLKKRFSKHRLQLRKGIHVNSNLQEDYDKYGPDSMEYTVILEYPCDTPSFVLEEQEKIEMLRHMRSDKLLYNSMLPTDDGSVFEEVEIDDEEMKKLIVACKRLNKTPSDLVKQYLKERMNNE